MDTKTKEADAATSATEFDPKTNPRHIPGLVSSVLQAEHIDLQPNDVAIVFRGNQLALVGNITKDSHVKLEFCEHHQEWELSGEPTAMYAAQVLLSAYRLPTEISPIPYLQRVITQTMAAEKLAQQQVPPGTTIN